MFKIMQYNDRLGSNASFTESYACDHRHCYASQSLKSKLDNIIKCMTVRFAELTHERFGR